MAGTERRRGRDSRLPLGKACSLTLVFLFAWVCAASSAPPNDDRAAGVATDLNVLVSKVIQNEINAQLYDNSLWCFREEKEEDSKPAKTVQVCGSRDGDLERVIAVNGRELSPAELQMEDERINKLLAHPAQLRAKQKKEAEDSEQLRKLLKDVAEAFQFQDAGGSNGELQNLHFHPNLAFRPSTRAETVFHHLEGTITIDRRYMRIAEMNGQITSEVKFMGGLLGHLDKGGTFHVKAAEVVPGHWDTTLLNLDLSGKALFFKTISVHQKEKYADYMRVPDDASLEQVAELLRKECNNDRTASFR